MSWTAIGLFAQVALSVVAPDTATVREPVMITVRAQAAGLAPPTVIAPSGAGFTLSRVGGVSRTVLNTFPPASFVEERYSLIPLRTGAVLVPPFEARLPRAAATRSASLRLFVRAPVAPRVPEVVARARIDPSTGVNFHALVFPETVYVGEQATYQVGVFLDDEVRRRLRRSPEFVPPELRSVMAYDLATPGALVARRTAEGREWEVHAFQRALFPLAAGRISIPPARLTYSLPLTASFFSREESYAVDAESLSVVALEPPAAGRPPGFRGAVGVLQVAAAVDPVRARAGDPVILTVRVSGSGNVNLLPRPDVAIAGAQVVAGAERVEVDSTTEQITGTKAFEWVVTPVRAGPLDVPAIRYVYFHPREQRYVVATTAPLRVDVVGGAVIAEAPAGDTTRLLPLRTSYRGAVPEPLVNRTGFWAVVALVPVPAAAASAFRRRRRRRAVRAPVALRRLARANTEADPARLRRLFIAAVSGRTGLAPAILADRPALVRALRKRGVTAVSAHRVCAVLAQLDAAVFGRGSARPDLLAGAAHAAYAAVDAEAQDVGGARPISGTVAWIGAGVLLGSVTASGLGAVDTARRETFDAATRLYTTRHFADAARLFAAVGAAQPRAPDAWANFGTSSWAVHDTAAAAVGWQRALRLEPTASDVRSRLAELGNGSGVGPLDVPPLSIDALSLTAVAAWAALWLALTVTSVRQRFGGRRAILALAGTTIVAAAAAGRATAARAADRLAVFTVSDRLRGLPALEADVGARVTVGEVARIERHEGAWSRVTSAGGRAGWIPTVHLRSIALDQGGSE